MGHSKFADLLEHYQSIYDRSTKKGKQEILSIMADLTGYNLKYLTRKLSEPLVVKKKIVRRRKLSKYEPAIPTIKDLWILAKFPCSVRLKQMMPIFIDALERYKELEISDLVKDLIASISERTLDRKLKVSRQNLRLKVVRGETKPGSLLKNQIPIKMWMDWDQTRPGFLEIDSVHHGGGYPSGHYCYTVSLEDVARVGMRTKLI